MILAGRRRLRPILMTALAAISRNVAPRLRARGRLADAAAISHISNRWTADFNGFVAYRHPSRVFPTHSNQASAQTSAGDSIVRS